MSNFRRDRARRRPVVPDGHAQGSPGVARLDAAAPHGKHPRAGDRRPGRRGPGPRAGASRTARRQVEVVDDPREGLGPVAGPRRRAWRPSPAGPRSRSSAPPTCRSCIRRSCGGCCGRWRGSGRGPARRPRLPAAAGRRLPHRRWPRSPSGWCASSACARRSCSTSARSPGWMRPRCAPTRSWPRWIRTSTRSLNVNEPADYAGGPGAPGTGGNDPAVRHPGRRPPRPAAGPGGHRGRRRGAAGLALDGHVVAALNGDQITRDGEVPLADRRHRVLPGRGRWRLIVRWRPAATSDGRSSSTRGRRRPPRCRCRDEPAARLHRRRRPRRLADAPPRRRPESIRWRRRHRWRSCSPRWSARR